MRTRACMFLSIAVLLPLAACGPAAETPAAAVPQAAPSGPPPVGGVIAGALGASLTDADRRTASDAQQEALAKGQRKSWKARTGTTFGFVEPGPESGACREYTHTVYFDGRPRSEKGQGCRQADGSWKV
jgi:surface antigen